MNLGNESPVGWATILAVAPGVVAGALFIYFFISNGGDAASAEAATSALISSLSFVVTGALRQWRAKDAPLAGGGADPTELEGGRPYPSGAEGEM